MPKGKKSLGSLLAKQGRPAKAGRRKQYTVGRRKTKGFGMGNGYCMESMERSSPPGSLYRFNPLWKTGLPVMILNSGGMVQ
jgi:hypothetical protein